MGDVENHRSITLFFCRLGMQVSYSLSQNWMLNHAYITTFLRMDGAAPMQDKIYEALRPARPAHEDRRDFE